VTHLGVGVGELNLDSEAELLDRVDWAAANLLPHLRSL
jgi:hypothetical protein